MKFFNKPMSLLKLGASFLVLTSIVGCKIEIDIQGDGEGTVTTRTSQNETSRYNCTSDASSDCMQQYVTRIDQCDGYDTVDPTTSILMDTWEELPNCTLVKKQFVTTITNCSEYEATDPNKDEWGEMNNCALLVTDVSAAAALINECPEYGIDNDHNEWSELNCAYATPTIAECPNYGAVKPENYDDWPKMPQCSSSCVDPFINGQGEVECTSIDINAAVREGGVFEYFVATPDEGNVYEGASECDGATAGCSHTVTYEYADQNDPVNDTVTVQAKFEPEPETVYATYELNHLGQRVKKTSGGVVTYFIYDVFGNVLAELDSSGNPVKQYMYLEGQYVGHVEQTGDTGAIPAETEEQVFYTFNDHLGQPYMQFRDDEQVSHEAYYTPYGAIHAQFTNVSVGTGPEAQNRRFPGQYYDLETGWHQNWMRDYDPSLGRYLESDPIGLAGGINTYAYVGGNPVNYIDPMGENGTPLMTVIHVCETPFAIVCGGAAAVGGYLGVLTGIYIITDVSDIGGEIHDLFDPNKFDPKDHTGEDTPKGDVPPGGDEPPSCQTYWYCDEETGEWIEFEICL